jgi:hypothetical protein
MTHQSTKGCGRFSTRGISNRWGIKGKEEEEKKEKQIRISETSVVLSLLPLLSSFVDFCLRIDQQVVPSVVIIFRQTTKRRKRRSDQKSGGGF